MKKCPKCGKNLKGKMMSYIEDEEGKEKCKPFWVPGRMKSFTWAGAGDDEYYPDEEIVVWETEDGQLWCGWYDNMNEAIFQTAKLRTTFDEVTVAEIREYLESMYYVKDLKNSMKIDKITKTLPDIEEYNSPEEIVKTPYALGHFLRHPEEEPEFWEKYHEKMEKLLPTLLNPDDEIEEGKPNNLEELR